MNWFQDDIEWIIELWTSGSANWSLLQSILVSFVICSINIVLCIINHLIRRGSVLEYGYPELSFEDRRQKLTKYSTFEKLILIRVIREVNKKGLYLYLLFFFNLLSLISAALEVIGLVACIISRGIGWSLVLLLFPGIGCLFITELIDWIPSTILLPSERKKYRIK